MKLILNTGTLADQGVIALPDDLVWTDEFSWVPVVQKKTVTLTGALIIETGVRLAGRTITLAADPDMAWVTRSTVLALRAWAALDNRQFTLTLEYPTDTRSFLVSFDQESNQAIEAHPVKGLPQHSPDDWFTLKLKFLQL
jgi:hypothetical protein